MTNVEQQAKILQDVLHDNEYMGVLGESVVDSEAQQLGRRGFKQFGALYR